METATGDAPIRRLFGEVINQNRLDVVDDICAPDYVNHGPFPWGVRDLEELKAFLLVRDLGFPDLQVTIDDLIVAGDLVAYRTTVRGTDTGEFLGIDPTGRPIEVPAIGFARVRDGRIAETWGVIDELDILRQIGVDLSAFGRHLDRRYAGVEASA